MAVSGRIGTNSSISAMRPAWRSHGTCQSRYFKGKSRYSLHANPEENITFVQLSASVATRKNLGKCGEWPFLPEARPRKCAAARQVCRPAPKHKSNGGCMRLRVVVSLL